MNRIVAALTACASVWAWGDEGILDEVNAGRKRTAEAVHSYYVRFTTHHVSIEHVGDDRWVKDVEAVVERWRDGDHHRVRRHSVETNTKNGAPAPDPAEQIDADAGDLMPQRGPRIRHAYMAWERDALLTPTDAYTRSREALGANGTVRLNPPAGAIRTTERVRRAATNQVRPGDWLNWAFMRHLTAARTNWKEVWDFETPIDDRANLIWARRGPYVMLRFLPEEGGDPLPGYNLFDPARGHLAVASEEGGASWADEAVLSDERYASVHFELVEAAPGVWLPKANTSRRLTSAKRSHSELRVLELRVNEPIDPAVFDRSNAGRWHSPRPAASVFPGEVVPVYRASMDEVTGKRERRAALDGEPPPAILEHPLRGEDGLPPIPSTSSTPAFDSHAALRWLVGIAIVAILCILTFYTLRREG